MNSVTTAITIDYDAVSRFCEKWRIRELSLFRSVLHPEQSREDSDVDVMIAFDDEASTMTSSGISPETRYRTSCESWKQSG